MNKALISKAHSLVVLALMLGSASLPAQSKKLSDLLNVQADEREVKATSSAPAGQNLSPGNTPSPIKRHTGAIASAGSPASDLSLAPRIKMSPLENMVSRYNSLKDRPSRESFIVSPDGQHCAYVESVGVAGYTVLIDGQPGPQFSGSITFGLYPTEDFSQVFFQTTDATRRSILVIQKRDGTAKVFLEKAYTTGTAERHDPNNFWVVYISESLRYRRLVRRHMINVPGKPQSFELQVDEDGPILGPFDAFPYVDFEDGSSHYLARGLMPVPDVKGGAKPAFFDAKRNAEPAVFLDGVRVCKDVLPLQVPLRNARFHAKLFGKSGGYWLRLSVPDQEIDIVNGKKVSWLPNTFHKDDLIPSEDGQHLAFTKETQDGRGIFLDGNLVASQPEQVRISELQLTGDGLGLVYLVQTHEGPIVFVDNRQTDITGYMIEGFVAGPHKGQFMCFVKTSATGDWQFVINERQLNLADNGSFRKGHQPEKVWFSADGQHVYGYQRADYSFVAFSDNLVSSFEVEDRSTTLKELQKPIIVGPDKWEIVSKDSNWSQARGKGLFKIEVELPQGKMQKTISLVGKW